MRIVRISTRPIVIAATVSHLYAIGMPMFIAPMETPLVERAEPISKIASVNDTPIVVNSTANMMSNTVNSRIEIIAGISS